MNSKFYLIALILFSLNSHAQRLHNIVFTGQETEEFKMDGLVSTPYWGTCYENEQWTTEDCSYNSSGDYSCRPVHHGSLTPYGCTEYSYKPGNGVQSSMDVKVFFKSTLVKPAIIFNTSLDKNGGVELKTQGLLPAGTVMGIKNGNRIYRDDTSFYHHSYVQLTTNEDLQKKFAEKIKKVSLDLKYRRLILNVVGTVTLADTIALNINTKKGFMGRESRLFSLTGTLGQLTYSGTSQVVPMAVKQIAPKETEIELDLIAVLGDQKVGALTLEFVQKQALDSDYVWTGVIDSLEKKILAPVKIR